MTETATDYLTRFSQLLLSTEATNGAGAALGLNEATAMAVDLLLNVRSAEGKVLLVGNGGGAAIASHMQNDLCKAVGVKAMVFTEPPLLTALTNDDGYKSAYATATRLWAEPGDLLTAISSSGRSENILRACDAALEAGGLVVTFSGFSPDNPLRSKGTINFYVPSDFYGYVESAHGVLGHCMTDTAARLTRKSQRPTLKESRQSWGQRPGDTPAPPSCRSS